MAKLRKIKTPSSFEKGIERVTKAFKEDPWQFTPVSMKRSVVPSAQTVGEAAGLPQLGEDVGYVLRGALDWTPFGGFGTDRLLESKDQFVPDTPRERTFERLGKGLYGAALMTPMAGGVPQAAKSLLTNSLVGAGLGAAGELAQNVISGEELTEDLLPAMAEGATHGFSTAPTRMLTTGLIQGASKTIPALKPLTEDAIQKTVPQAGQTLTDWFDSVKGTGLKRILKAAILETPIEGLVYGLQTAKPDEKLLNNIVEEAYQNLIFNVTYAGAQTARDAFVPVIKQSIDEAVNVYSQMTPEMKQAGFAKIPGKDTVFHGTGKPSGKAILGTGTYVTGSKDVAKRYGDTITEYKIKPGTKLLDLTDSEKMDDFMVEAMTTNNQMFTEIAKKEGQDAAMGQVMRKHAKELGYEGVKGVDEVFGTVVFDENNLINSGIGNSNDFLRLKEYKLGDLPSDVDPVARERFNIPELKKLSGGGSDREVFDLGDKVLKVAKTARGLQQNMYEGEPYAPVPEAIEKGKNYVVVDKVFPPDKRTKDLVKKLGDAMNFNSPEPGVDAVNTVAGMYPEDSAEANLLYDLLNYDLMYNDLTSIRNWGTDSDGDPILVDAGTLAGNKLIDEYRGKKNLDDPEFRDIYETSKKAKKSFGDIDKYTMFGATLPLLATQRKTDSKKPIPPKPSRAAK